MMAKKPTRPTHSCTVDICPASNCKKDEYCGQTTGIPQYGVHMGINSNARSHVALYEKRDFLSVSTDGPLLEAAARAPVLTRMNTAQITSRMRAKMPSR